MDNVQDIIMTSENFKVKNEFSKAIDMLQKAIIKYNNEFKLYEELADIYLYKGDMKRAEKSANFALSINSKSATGNYLKGFILLSNSKTIESIKYLEKSNGIMKNNPEVLRNLGWAYTMNSQTQKGISILKRALNIAPKDELITKDLAIALIGEGKVNEGNKLLEDLGIDIE